MPIYIRLGAIFLALGMHGRKIRRRLTAEKENLLLRQDDLERAFDSVEFDAEIARVRRATEELRKLGAAQ